MEVGRSGRSSISGRLEATSFSPTSERNNLATCAKDDGNCQGHHHEQLRRQLQLQPQPQPQQQHHLKNRSMKMFNKVQVVYYISRNGQLEHPHFMEVSHLATQPLRLKDVLDRLTVLRGKAMPCQYSWSCKRSYKNGYVWNDLTENDVIYAAEGSEYVLKGSEIISETDFNEIRLDEVQNKRRQQRKRSQLNTSGLVTNKPGVAAHHQGRIHAQVDIKNCEQEAVVKNCNQTENHDDDDEEEEEEEKRSCNSSNTPYPTMQIEQEESYSLHSTSSNNSDKQPTTTTTTTAAAAATQQRAKISNASEAKRSDHKEAVSTSLTRNSAALLHLIACGGGITSSQGNGKAKDGGNRNNFNFRMKSSFMPCLRQQLSTRGDSTDTNAAPLRLKGVGVGEQRHDEHHQVVSKDDDDEDEDMMMVRYMSENPLFGNLQSEDKEYFSGTIIEAMSTHHQHTHSIGSASSHPLPHPPPVLTKSSSYNEQRNSKAGLQAEASKTEDEDDEKEDAKVTGIIKLCIPRKKSCSSNSTKHT